MVKNPSRHRKFKFPTTQAVTNLRHTGRLPIPIPQFKTYAREVSEEERKETYATVEEEEILPEIPAPRRARRVAISPPQCAADAHKPLVWSETLIDTEETPDLKNYWEDTDNEADMITRAWVDDAANNHARRPITRAVIRRSPSPREPNGRSHTLLGRSMATTLNQGCAGN